MEEVFFWDNPDIKSNKTVMYSENKSAPRWKEIFKVFEDKCSDLKMKHYNVYVYCSLPYPPHSKIKKDFGSKFLIGTAKKTSFVFHKEHPKELSKLN